MPKNKGFFDIGDTEEAEKNTGFEDTEPDNADLADIGGEGAAFFKRNADPKLLIVMLIAAIAVAAFFMIRWLYDNSDGDDSRYIPDEWLQVDNDKQGPTIYLYKPDWETDINTVQEYLELKGEIFYIEGNSGRSVDEHSYFQVGGKGLEFMAEYVETLRSGNHEKLNSMFTEEYFKDHERYEAFPQQKVFGVYISKHDLKIDENDESMYYVISYRIYRNDGLFRNDIDDTTERSQLFTLVKTSDGSIKIDDVINVNYVNR